MKLNDLNKVLNERVSDLMKAGYQIDVISGDYLSSCVLGKVVPVKGNDAVVVSVEDKNFYLFDTRFSERGCVVTERNGHKDVFGSIHAETKKDPLFESEPIFCVHGTGNIYVSKEEFVAIEEKKKAKRELRNECRFRKPEKSLIRNLSNDANVLRIIHKLLKKKPGMKRCHIEDIERVSRNIDWSNNKFCYSVVAKGKMFVFDR